MSTQLPQGLREAVADWLGGHAGSRRQGSAALSATYRAGGGSARIDFASYLVARLPATFAAVDRVLGELAGLRPDLAPASLLDAGSGPGTASWAALAHWPDVSAVTFLDSSEAFLQVASALAARGPAPLAAATALRASMAELPKGLAADLVVAAYALAELPLAQAAAVASQLWQASAKALVLVEPGTPQGFARLRAARERLIAAGGMVIAPCTGLGPCPMTGDDWCHFSVRLARSRAHMHAKAAQLPFEDERFAYLTVVRDGAATAGARIIAPPQHAKPGVTLRLCAAGSIESRHVARRDGAAYKQVKKLDWGDRVDPALEENTR